MTTTLTPPPQTPPPTFAQYVRAANVIAAVGGRPAASVAELEGIFGMYVGHAIEREMARAIG